MVFGAVLANPPARESRQFPVEVMDGLIWVDDDFVNRPTVFTDEPANPTMVSTRNTGTINPTPTGTVDQQPEEQRYPYVGGFGGGYGVGWGRPYGIGRPYGYGRPWGPYGRPWGPYSPYRPWGPF